MSYTIEESGDDRKNREDGKKPHFPAFDTQF